MPYCCAYPWHILMANWLCSNLWYQRLFWKWHPEAGSGIEVPEALGSNSGSGIEVPEGEFWRFEASGSGIEVPEVHHRGFRFEFWFQRLYSGSGIEVPEALGSNSGRYQRLYQRALGSNSGIVPA
ncbi:hypothetical protein CEXT_603021 [Caerostris extrusa]|uniref:Uncharacterized protein n=1 Tax=Caerostris extrusa TaxID=172846 RepID=A0AAV4NSY3_CAEEX|nr:hypothetical protein CEXT_603021 [Caerostris extrusa]